MFGLFSKKEMDIKAAESFWAWFLKNEDWIIANSRNMDVVWAIDGQLKPIFPYFTQELEFQLGYNKGKGEFFFFHFNNSSLKRHAQTLKEMMPAQLAERWSFILEK